MEKLFLPRLFFNFLADERDFDLTACGENGEEDDKCLAYSDPNICIRRSGVDIMSGSA